jgi:hypothetical protein
MVVFWHMYMVVFTHDRYEFDIIRHLYLIGYLLSSITTIVTLLAFSKIIDVEQLIRFEHLIGLLSAISLVTAGLLLSGTWLEVVIIGYMAGIIYFSTRLIFSRKKWLLFKALVVPVIWGCTLLSGRLASGESIIGELSLSLSIGIVLPFVFLVLAIPIWLIVGLLISLPQGFSVREIEFKTVPGEGVQRSARNALWIASLFGVLLIISTVLLWLLRDIVNSEGTLLIGLCQFAMLVLGAAASLALGGMAVIKHAILRLILYRSGHIPWNYSRFLDYAAERVLLRKVGGGYIFMHRLLLGHFAQLEVEKPKNQTPVES